MLTPTEPASSPPSGNRTAARWIGALGVVLLLLAGGVLVAVRWDHIAESAKLAGLVLLNTALVLGGRRLRATLAATGDAVFHLGALLVPVSVSAAAMLGGLGWDLTLLSASVAATVVWLALARVVSSEVLGWASRVAVLGVAGGVAALTGVPAVLLVAGAVIAAVAANDQRGFLVMAPAALALPLLSQVDDLVTATNSVLDRLTLTTTEPLIGAGAALATSVAFAIDAHRRSSTQEATLAVLAAAWSCGLALLSPSTPSQLGLLVLATIGLVTALAALVAGRHELWGPVLRRTAAVGDIALVVGTVNIAARTLTEATGWVEATGVAPIAALVAVIGWLITDQRRHEGKVGSLGLTLLLGSGFAPATIGVTASGLALAWAALPGGPAVVASALIGLLAVISGRPLAQCAAVGAVSVGLFWVGDRPWQLAAAIIGTATLASAAAIRERVLPDDPAALILTLLASAPAAVAAGVLDHWLAGAGPGAFALLMYLVAISAERINPDPVGRGVGLLARAIALVGFLTVTGWADPALLALGLVVTTLAMADWLRTGDLRLALPAGLVAPAVVGGSLAQAGLGPPAVGLGMLVLATVLVGLQLTARTWTSPAVVAIGTLGLMGFGLAADTQPTLALAFALIAADVAFVGLARRSPWLLSAATAIATPAVWIGLSLADITSVDLYLVPVALTLVASGLAAGRVLSSWLTYGPAIVIVTSAALAERLGDAAGWHSLLAGAVGLAAAAAGAQWRLSAPLVLGSAALVGVALLESLGYAATVPTWTWLATGGVLLLALATHIERSDQSPLASSRHILATLKQEYR